VHTPIDQALGIVTNTTNLEPSQRFADFVTGEKGREILRRFGYDFPPS
jgi:ABC-type molybdate transport system substrate-binding protein